MAIAVGSGHARGAGRPAEDREASTRQGNVWGINFAFDPGASANATIRVLGLARSLVGDWGYLRHGMSLDPDMEATRRGMAMIRAHHLIPILGGAAPDAEFCEKGKHFPRSDPDGSMRTAARAKARIWKRLHEARIPAYAVEVMNEVNLDQKMPPEKYAQWLYDFAVEAKAAYPGLKVCSCGMAGSGEAYYDRMLTYRPELKQVIDFWGLHPYAANNPPQVDPAECTLRSYELTARVLARHGIDPVRLMCTETGYELEGGPLGKNTSFPAINEENRAGYMVRAFRDYYVPDPRIEMVAPFLLWDLSWHDWDGWSYIGADGRPKPIYRASQAAPKTGGKDWLPVGEAVIEGRITWQDTDIGVPRAVVYTDPGLYGAVTDDTGRYRIEGLPPGDYRVQVLAAGFRDGHPQSVTASQTRAGNYSARLIRESLIGTEFSRASNSNAAGIPRGWEAISRQMPDVCSVDSAVLDPQRNSTLRIDLSAPAEVGLYRYGSYHSAYPGEVYLAEVYVRSAGPRIGRRPGGGPWLELSTANGRGELLRSSRATASGFEADGGWHRITIAGLAPARGSRVRISIGVSGAEGSFWFSQPFVGEADFPLPGDASFGTTGYVPPQHDQNRGLFGQAELDVKKRNPRLATATVAGRVTDFRNRPLPLAVVGTDSPVFVAVTDERGEFSLVAPAGRKMRVRVFDGGLSPLVTGPRAFESGQRVRLDLRCKAPPAGEALVNGGFNQFSKDNSGQLHGWSTFGTTDGSVASGKTIFEVPSFEGDGLYLAQAGSNVKNGGAYQTIKAVPGTKFRLSAQVYTRTQDDGKRPLDTNCRIGIDPTGGRDPDSPDVVWATPTESEQKWTPIKVEATAGTERITVFIRHEMRRANTWNLALFDDVQLTTAD